MISIDVTTPGFSITAEELANRVKEYVSSSAITGWNNLGAAIGGLKATDLRWANALELKNAVESAFTEKFGAKGAAKPKGKVRPCHERSVNNAQIMSSGAQEGECRVVYCTF